MRTTGRGLSVDSVPRSFPYITDEDVSVTKQEGCSYSVRAYVDAQNSFGAKVRTRYSVNVRPSDGDNWYATNLKM